MNNGLEIPKLALGTWLIDNDRVAEAVCQAVKIGYRHIDTAQAYGNECGVGEGLRICGVSRDKIFVTSKVAAEHKTYESAASSIDETLNRMKLDYIDMMIIHSPQPWVEVNQSDNRYFKENKEIWKAMEDAVKAGKIRTIGVSNFLEKDMDNILSDCKISPAVNQILAHISNTPLKLIDYCKSKNILVEAYSPIAHGEALKNKAIKEMADKYNKSVAQVILRWLMQRNVVALAKSVHKERMKENFNIFDFTLNDEDINKINGLDNSNSLFFSHADPSIVEWFDKMIGERRRNQDSSKEKKE